MPVNMSSLRGCIACLLMGLITWIMMANVIACTAPSTCSTSDNLHDLRDTVGYLQRHLRQISGGVEPCMLPTDCSDVYRWGERKGGHYQIQPEGACAPFSVYCEFGEDGVAWTLLQRRVNNMTDFNRTWDEYRNGFGIPGPAFNFWLGLEKMHHLTTQRQNTIKFEITDWNDETRYANYSLFYISDESTDFTLMYDGYQRGTLVDGLGDAHKGLKFSTPDRDNDLAGGHCAQSLSSGWWYSACFSGGVSLNANYPLPTVNDTWVGIQWLAWKYKYPFKGVTMKITPTV